MIKRIYRIELLRYLLINRFYSAFLSFICHSLLISLIDFILMPSWLVFTYDKENIPDRVIKVFILIYFVAIYLLLIFIIDIYFLCLFWLVCM
jgi:hypothetical protein